MKCSSSCGAQDCRIAVGSEDDGSVTGGLQGVTHRVGPKGQVLIPTDLRDELGIEPGDEMKIWPEG